MQMDSRASSWAMVARGPRAIDRYRSALILKRRGKRARLFRDRAISTLIFDEREMELLAHHSVIVRVAAAFWTAGEMESAARRLKRAVLVVPADVNPSS